MMMMMMMILIVSGEICDRSLLTIQLSCAFTLWCFRSDVTDFNRS